MLIGFTRNWIFFCRISLVFLVCFFADSLAYACGWYPEAEVYRFVMFNPELSNRRYEPFYFTSYFMYDYENLENRQISNRKNIEEWITYTKFKGSYQAIDYVLNYITPEVFAENIELPQSKLVALNPFIQHLIKTGNKEAMQYLQFAKSCEVINSVDHRDPWLQQATDNTTEFNGLIAEGEKLYTHTQQAFLQFRYGFQLVRLARYLGDHVLVSRLYKKYIEPYPSQSIIYYWAMWHYAEMQEDKASQNYLASLVFNNAHDKKVVAWQFFNRSHTQQSLAYAKNNHEKAGILVMNELHNPGRSLAAIQKIYNLDPSSDALESLLIREINKLEDWILTPRYTDFEPAVDYRSESYDYHTKNRNAYFLKNYQKDLVYLTQVLSFIENITKKKVHTPALWDVMAAYLAYMNNQFDKSSKYLVSALTAKGLNKRIEAQAHLIRIITELNPQRPATPQTDAVLLAELKWIENNKSHLYHDKHSFSKLMMALTNRYWEAGDMVRATLCHSKVFDFVRFESNFFSEKDSISYEVDYISHAGETGMNFYSSYLFFLDEKATTSDIEQLLAFLDKKSSTPLEAYLAKGLLKDKDRITDLLGIKYLRNNNLYKARDAFKKVSPKFWSSDKESYKNYLDANPFYTNFYQEHEASPADVVKFTKYSLVDSLIHVIERADNPKEPNRAKWYFLAANCYLNMTYWGNSWIMTRYWWSRNEVSSYSYRDHPYSTYPDNATYYECDQAMSFYLKAKQFAKNKKQEAFCLRMVGRCQYYSLLYTDRVDETIYDYNQSKEIRNPRYTTNSYYEQLEKQYPDFYEELMFQCTSFDTYFKDFL